MKKLLMVAPLTMLLAGCGYVQREGEMVGQGKKVAMRTPLICPDYSAFDLSLGVIRNGSGSMSAQDMWFTVAPGVNVTRLKRAVEDGSIIKIKYDTRRLAICAEENVLTGFDVIP